jgi:hypothetical protein
VFWWHSVHTWGHSPPTDLSTWGHSPPTDLSTWGHSPPTDLSTWGHSPPTDLSATHSSVRKDTKWQEKKIKQRPSLQSDCSSPNIKQPLKLCGRPSSPEPGPEPEPEPEPEPAHLRNKINCFYPKSSSRHPTLGYVLMRAPGTR